MTTPLPAAAAAMTKADSDALDALDDVLRLPVASTYPDGPCIERADMDALRQARDHFAAVIAQRDALRALTAPAGVPDARDREADRRRFPCDAFNDWLDTGISDCGHIVWHTVGDIADAWAGWEACVYRGERNNEADNAMVERACDAYIKTGSSMAAALIEAFASVEQVDAAREAFRQVYDVEIHGDGSRSDNRDAAMRAALLAAQGETK